MTKNSASRFIGFIAIPFMLSTVWAETEKDAGGVPLNGEASILRALKSSIKPLDSYASQNENIASPTGFKLQYTKGLQYVPPGKSQTGLGVILSVGGEHLEYRFNTETNTVDVKPKNPYSLEEYINNGKISHTSGFLSDTEINCLPKFNLYQHFTDIVGEVDKCFTKKPDLSQRQLLSQDVLLKMDQDICNCLYNTKNADVAKIMNSERMKDHGARTDAMVKADIQNKMMDMAAKASALQDGMMFQSHMLYYDPTQQKQDNSKDPTLKYGTPFVSQIFKAGGEAQKYLVGRSGEVANLAINLRGDTPQSSKKSDAKLADQLTKEISNISIQNKSAAVLSEGEFKPGQCISAKEFFSYKQFPDSSSFYKNLMSEKSFDPKKWNYITLEKELKAKSNTIPYTEESKREMEEIREKLRFLHRNPMLKTLMAADHDFDEYAKKIKTLKPEMKAHLEKTSRRILDQKKKGLFELVKKHFTPANASCVNGAKGACQEDVVKNVKAFDEDMKKFFNDQDVALLTRVQAEKSTFHLIDEFIENPIPQERVPLKQDELEDFVYKDVINVAENDKKENFINPGECRAVDSPYSSSSADGRCVMTYAVYCPVVNKAQTQLAKKMLRNEILPNGEEKIKSITYKNYFEPDIDKNPEFKAFNDAFCDIPRKGTNGKQSISFNAFRDSFCKTNSANKHCANRSYENIMALRQIYDEGHEEAILSGNATSADVDMVNNALKLIKGRPTSNRSKQDAQAIANSDAGIVRDVMGLNRFVSDLESFGGMADKKEVDPYEKFESASMLSNISNAVENVKLNSSQPKSSVYSEEFSGYSNIIAPQEITEADKVKVDKLPQTTKEELLSQWREELNEFKRNNQSESTESRDSEAGLKAKIAALETLLEQQRKLTDEQYKILNNAISNPKLAQVTPAAQNNQAASQKSNEDDDFQEKVKVRSASGFAASGSHAGNIAEETFRGPASIKDSSFSNSGSSGGASASVQRSSSSSGAVSAAASDSLAREEAKLINLRRHADGSISIDTNTKGAQFTPNAITLPVSDEQYRLLQSNPTALNLSQIEKSIPKDQLEKLEKLGEIILVLQNGENPPFEVKLEKKDNQLVYQVRDNNGQKVNPVRRIYTREALELELKVQ